MCYIKNFFRCFRDFIKCLFNINKHSFAESTSKDEYTEMKKEQDIDNNVMGDDYIVKKMELQLHEQYAINNNANLSSIVAIIVALVVVLGYWGLVYVEEDKCSNKFMIVSIGTFFVLTITSYLCLYQGFQQRYEQFITYAIRCKYYKCRPEKEKDIFPQSYTPFEKKWFNVPQGLYNFLFRSFFVAEILIIILSILKLIKLEIDILFCIFVISPFISIMLIICFYKEKINKYENLKKEFNENIEKIILKKDENKTSQE